jgi:hypothetical protein
MLAPPDILPSLPPGSEKANPFRIEMPRTVAIIGAMIPGRSNCPSAKRRQPWHHEPASAETSGRGIGVPSVRQTWNNGAVFLAEVADIPIQEIINTRRLLHYRLRGEHTASVQCGRGIVYQTSFQVESLPPEIFLHVHDEIVADGAKRGLLHNFQPNHRLAIAPLGFVTVETRARCLFINSFHTFPDENAVVKAQSLIEKVD